MEQLGFQEDLAVGDGNHVGGNIGGYVARLGFNDRQRRDGAAAVLGIDAGGALQQAGMQVEYVAGVGFTSGRAADQQGKGAVGHRMLAQIVVYNQHVLALIHEVFSHRAPGIGGDVLQRRQLAGRGADHGSILHRARGGQGIHQLGDGGALLADGHVNADHVLATLVDNGVQSDHRLTGLTVADDQLALAAADGDHAVDGLDARLQRHGNALALDDAGGIALDGAVFLGFNIALAVHGLAQSVDHAANQRFADGHGYNLARALHGVALADALVVAQHNDSHGVFLQVQRHAVFAVGEAHQLIGHALFQAAHTGNAVADHQDGAGIVLGNLIFVILNLLFNELGNFLGFYLHHITAFSR